MIYKKRQISPISVGDLAQGLAVLPCLPRPDSEWKQKSWRGEIPGVWRGRRQRLLLSKDLLSAPRSLGVPAPPPWPCRCRQRRAAAVIAVPPPSLPWHRRHRSATTLMTVPLLSLRAIAVIAMPLPSSPCHHRRCCATAVIPLQPSLLCHHHHHDATAVIAVQPLSSLCHHCLCQQGTGHWPNPLGRVGSSGSLPCKPALQVVAAFWGPSRNRLSPGGIWVGSECQHTAGAQAVPVPVKARGTHGSPRCGQRGSVISLLFLESWLPSSFPQPKKLSQHPQCPLCVHAGRAPYSSDSEHHGESFPGTCGQAGRSFASPQKI